MDLFRLDPILKAALQNARLTTYSPYGRGRNVPYTISCLTDARITFLIQNGNEQTARRTEVDFVANQWEQIKKGEVRRKALLNKSRNTSYLFGILHFIDQYPQQSS